MPLSRASPSPILTGSWTDYYDAHAADLDSYDYRFCYINAEFEDKTDEDGNTVEPTEEETKALWTPPLRRPTK